MAVDPEGDDLTWTLDGTDADDFDIAAGALTFKTPPDFEAPTDSGRNNGYDVTVQVTDDGEQHGLEKGEGHGDQRGRGRNDKTFAYGSGSRGPADGYPD